MAETEGPRAATGAQQDTHWKELVVFWVENLAKLALPIVTAIVARERPTDFEHIRRSLKL